MLNQTLEEMLNELQFELFKIVFLGAFLDSAILFLVLTLLLSVMSMGLAIPLIASLAYLVLRTYLNMKRLSLKRVEEKNPEIREMLRTAADNRESNTVMAQALFLEVITKMKKVSSGSFLEIDQIIRKLLAIFILSGLLFTIGFFNINISKFDNPFANLHLGLNKEKTADTSDNLDQIVLGDQAVDLTLKENLNQIDFNKVENPEDTGSLAYEGDVSVDAKAAATYDNSLENINDRKTAAEYSQKIK